MNCPPALPCATRFVLLLLVLLLDVPSLANSQGLVKDPDALLSASSAYENVKKLIQLGAKWRREFQDNPKAACSSNKASLCSSNPDVEGDPDVTLFWATVPPVYDQRTPRHTGGFNAVSRPLDQGKCYTCASFAVASAAETAIALTLQRNATHMLSVQDLHFCNAQENVVRDCRTPWTLLDAVTALTNLHAKSKPVPPECLPYNPDSSNRCNYECANNNNTILHLGRGFQQKPLSSIYDIQEWLLTKGSVVASIEVYEDHLKSFFLQDKDGIYLGHNDTNAVNYGHAVHIIGFDNIQKYWIVKNSWGTTFANGGYFRVAFGASGIGKSSFGLQFLPFQHLGSERMLTPTERTPAISPNKESSRPATTCYEYNAREGDTVPKVAAVFGATVRRLLADNLDTLSQDRRMYLQDSTLLLCNVSQMLLPPKTQIEALLRIKAVIDKNDVLKWSPSDNAVEAKSTEYCGWEGIRCDEDRNVDGLGLNGNSLKARLVGGLPDVLSLLGLPKLTTIDLPNNRLSGTLPPGYQLLKGLKQLWIYRVPGLVGTLPPEWGSGLWTDSLQELSLPWCSLAGSLPQSWSGMHKLERLGLNNNSFTGTLPAAWANMTNLTRLHVHNNDLTGSLPPEYGSMDLIKQLYAYNNVRMSGTLPEGWGPGMKSLEGLRLGAVYANHECGSKRSMLSGTLPPQWSSMSNLMDLNITCAQISGGLPLEWGNLTWMKDFDLSFNNLTGTLPPEWSSMERLRYLYMDAAGVSGTIPAGLVQSWSKLHSLWAQGNELTGPLPSLPSKIIELRLTANRFEATLPSEYSKAQTLQHLAVGNNMLTGLLPASLGELPDLTHLDLSVNRFEGGIPDSWGDMRSLKVLRLSDRSHSREGNMLYGTLRFRSNLTELQV